MERRQDGRTIANNTICTAKSTKFPFRVKSSRADELPKSSEKILTRSRDLPGRSQAAGDGVDGEENL
ncbi:MAG TPA: hypothetical protein VMS23_03050, partial [Terrimicrobiaceae bacterium]|nr:hypothetical protein [Terrimicrobiaceae bacterium]